MYGPAYINHDVTLGRRIQLGRDERRELQLRAEAFNVFNHPQFTGVNSGFTYSPCTVGNAATPDCIASPSGGYRNTNQNIGALTGERGPRIISLELRVQF